MPLLQARPSSPCRCRHRLGCTYLHCFVIDVVVVVLSPDRGRHVVTESGSHRHKEGVSSIQAGVTSSTLHREHGRVVDTVACRHCHCGLRSGRFRCSRLCRSCLQRARWVVAWATRSMRWRATSRVAAGEWGGLSARRWEKVAVFWRRCPAPLPEMR
jgi:hypothetical protein